MGALDRFIGFRNYVQALNHSVFQRAFINNMLIIAVSLFLQLPLVLGLGMSAFEGQTGVLIAPEEGRR
jgi:raffinose/stachyose/melibiose transport system permease protein